MLLRTATIGAPSPAVNACPVARVCRTVSDLPTEAPTDREAAATDDAALVRAARAGDRFAFGQLYQRYGGMVHGVLLARVRSEIADDLVQDVFIKAMTELRHLRDEASFGAWLAAIARNRAYDHYRRSREMHELPPELPVNEHTSSDAEARVALAAIQELPEAYRETLMLRLVEGMSGPEIAARTGLTPESVRVNLHRGIKLLRQRLEGRPA